MGAFRIARSKDRKCWIIQEWQEPGISPKTGKRAAAGHWKDAHYYGNLADLIPKLLDLSVDLPAGDNLGEQIAGLRAELKAAEGRIVAQFLEPA